MFFDHGYLSALLFVTNAVALPQGSPTGTSPFDVFINPNGNKLGNNGTVRPLIRLTGWEGCDIEDPCNPKLDKKAAIRKGFEDMQMMKPAYEDISDPSDPPRNAYSMHWEDAAAVEFFGSFQKTGEHREIVQSKFLQSPSQKVQANLLTWEIPENLNMLVRVLRWYSQISLLMSRAGPTAKRNHHGACMFVAMIRRAM
jgi:hypothetical protein